MTIIRKNRLIHFVIIITVLTTSLYVVSRNLPSLIGSFVFFWAPLALVLIVFNLPKVIQSSSSKYLLLYGIICLAIFKYFLWHYMLDWDYRSLLKEFYSLVVFIIILNYYIIRKDYKNLATIGKFSFYFILITILMTHIALFIEPNLLRDITSTSTEVANEKIFKITGAAGYGYMQALVCFLPILIYHIKYNKKLIFKRKTLILILILILLLQFRAQFFANILVAIGISILSFAGTKRAKKLIYPLTIIIVILIVIPKSVYIDMLQYFSSFFEPNSTVYSKIIDISTLIQTKELESTIQISTRAERYPLLIEAFISNPLFGDASYNSPFDTWGGGHLHWMNRLAIFGLLGFSFYFLAFYKIFKSISSLFDESYRVYFFLSIMAFIFLGLMKTIAGREPYLILIVVIPGLYFLSVQENEKI